MPSHDDGHGRQDAHEQRLTRLRAMADAEAARLRASSVQGAQVFSDAATVLVQKLGLDRLRSDAPGAGPHDRRVIQNVARKLRRAERTWTRHHRPLSAAAEPVVVPDPPCDEADELAHLPAPLREVADLARRAFEPADIARRLKISKLEVGRRAFWILVRRTERGAALPPELGLAPGSLVGLRPALRHRALRCLHAVGCGPAVMALDCGKSASAVQKDLERVGIAKRRR